MEKINEYIGRLESLQDELKTNLREKGLNIPDHYTFTELVPKVMELSNSSAERPGSGEGDGDSPGSEEYEWGYGKYNICIFNTRALVTNYQEGQVIDAFLSATGLRELFEFRNPSGEGFEGFPVDENLAMKVRTASGEEKFIPVVYTNNITAIGSALPRTFKAVTRWGGLRNKFF